MKANEKCNITNRSPGTVSYYIHSTRTTRDFPPGVTYTVNYSEIEEVSKQPGGRELLYNYFYIDKMPEIAEDLLIHTEPEYFIPENELDNWMNTSSLDAFKDALDYAPDGMRDLIKKHAVTLPLNDMAKCEAIKEQLGFDVIMAIRNERDTLEDEDKKEIPAPANHGRRANVESETPAVAARRTTPKYKVVSKENS